MAQSFAGIESNLPKTQELHNAMVRATLAAKDYSHRVVTLEHLLFVLLDDPDADAVIVACNVEVAPLKNALIEFFVQGLVSIQSAALAEPFFSSDIESVLADAETTAESVARPELDGAIVLLSLLNVTNCTAAQIASAHGLMAVHVAGYLGIPAAVNDFDMVGGKIVAPQDQGAPEETQALQPETDKINLPPPVTIPDLTKMGGRRSSPESDDAVSAQEAQVDAPPSSGSGPVDVSSRHMSRPGDSGSEATRTGPPSVQNEETPLPNNGPGGGGPGHMANRPQSTRGALEHIQRGRAAQGSAENRGDFGVPSNPASDLTVDDLVSSVKEIIGEGPASSPVSGQAGMPGEAAPGPVHGPQDSQAPVHPSQSVGASQIRRDHERVGARAGGRGFPDGTQSPTGFSGAPGRDGFPAGDRQRSDNRGSRKPGGRGSHEKWAPMGPPPSPAPSPGALPPTGPVGAPGRPAGPLPRQASGEFGAPQTRGKSREQAVNAYLEGAQRKRVVGPGGGAAPYAQHDASPRGPAGHDFSPPDVPSPSHGGMTGPMQRSPINSRLENAVETGTLAENIPRVMRAGAAVDVEVRIGRGGAIDLDRGMPGATVQHEVSVAEAMTVQLRAPQGGFQIDVGAPETQWVGNKLGAVGGEDFGRWRWTVIPTGRGRKRLQLELSARVVDENGLIAETAMPEQVIVVNVKINYIRTAKQVAGWGAAAIAGGALSQYGEGIVRWLGGLFS